MSELNKFDSIESKNFVEFEKAIKADLDSKIANSEEIKQAKSSYEKLEDIKSMFAKINTDYGSSQGE